MSRYAGNNEQCPRCGLKYRDLRSGTTWEEVRLGLWTASNDPGDWRYKRRGSVLGKWHQFKQEAWLHHLEVCQGEPHVDLRLPRWEDTSGAGF